MSKLKRSPMLKFLLLAVLIDILAVLFSMLVRPHLIRIVLGIILIGACLYTAWSIASDTDLNWKSIMLMIIGPVLGIILSIILIFNYSSGLNVLAPSESVSTYKSNITSPTNKVSRYVEDVYPYHGYVAIEIVNLDLTNPGSATHLDETQIGTSHTFGYLVTVAANEAVNNRIKKCPKGIIVYSSNNDSDNGDISMALMYNHHDLAKISRLSSHERLQECLNASGKTIQLASAYRYKNVDDSYGKMDILAKSSNQPTVLKNFCHQVGVSSVSFKRPRGTVLARRGMSGFGKPNANLKIYESPAEANLGL